MQIILNPVRLDQPLALIRKGDTLMFNGHAVDLASYDPEVTPCDWMVAPPVRTPQGWQVQIILPHGADAPHETRFPRPITVTGNGPVALPPYDAPAPEPDPADLNLNQES